MRFKDSRPAGLVLLNDLKVGDKKNSHSSSSLKTLPGNFHSEGIWGSEDRARTLWCLVDDLVQRSDSGSPRGGRTV